MTACNALAVTVSSFITVAREVKNRLMTDGGTAGARTAGNVALSAPAKTKKASNCC
jgi:hypothetical protein